MQRGLKIRGAFPLCIDREHLCGNAVAAQNLWFCFCPYVRFQGSVATNAVHHTSLFDFGLDQGFKKLKGKPTLLEDSQKTNCELIDFVTRADRAHRHCQGQVLCKKLCRWLVAHGCFAEGRWRRTSRNSSYFSLTAISVKLLNSVP